MTEWKAIGVVVEGQPIDVDGINPWQYSWRPSKQPPIELPHPAYPNQRHRMTIYEVETGGRTVVFAAGELSANVWGFYVAA